MGVLEVGNDGYELTSIHRYLNENRQWNERPSVESDGGVFGMARYSSVVGRRGAGEQRYAIQHIRRQSTLEALGMTQPLGVG